MAKGWESKGVEEQQAEPRSTDVNGPPSAKVQRASGDIARARQSLELQREQILNARTSNPHRRAALESALAEIEARLAAIV